MCVSVSVKPERERGRENAFYKKFPSRNKKKEGEESGKQTRRTDGRTQPPLNSYLGQARVACYVHCIDRETIHAQTHSFQDIVMYSVLQFNFSLSGVTTV